MTRKQIQTYRKAVFILVYTWGGNEAEYLILRRKLHWAGWEFPKGGVEEDENLIDAVKRELKEETGLKPIKIKKYNVKGKYKYDNKTRKERGFLGQSYQLFSAEVKKGKVKIDRKEHSFYMWLDFKEAMKKLTWKNQKKCLEVVNKFVDKR